MRKLLLSVTGICSLALCAPAHAGQDITYYDGDTTLEGYWAPSVCPQTKDDPENTPVIMIIHQWKGLGDYEKIRADMLADQCYNAFAIDMYGKGVRPKTREDAAKQAGIYKNDPALARHRAQIALDYVRQHHKDAPVAVMGYCFGGTMALELARSGADLAGVVSFHGGLATKAPVTEKGIIKAPIEIHHGAADPHVTQQEVTDFMAEMDQAGADWQLTQYAGAVHAFTEKEAGNDPSTGAAYNEKADKRSWAATLNFLKEIFGR